MPFHFELKKVSYYQKPFINILEGLAHRPWLSYGVRLLQKDVQDEVWLQVLAVDVGQYRPHAAEVFDCLLVLPCQGSFYYCNLGQL